MDINIFKDLKIGDHFKFGNYWQGANKTEGKSPIEWIVLSKGEKGILSVSLYCLDCKKFNEERIDPIWKNSDIRKWLNEYFIQETFSDEEKDFILQKDLINDNNIPIEKAQDKTADRVFLLSLQEIRQYFETNESRMAAPTKFAVANNAYEDVNYKTKEGKGTCYWWSRSIGNHFSNTHVVGVNYFGYIGASGNLPTANNFAIRPALWIKR